MARVKRLGGTPIPDGDVLPVEIVSGSTSGTEYTEGAADTTITGSALLWEDTGDVLRVPSAAKPLPVEVIAGATSGTEYQEGATDSTITGRAILWEDSGDTLVVPSAASPLPVEIIAGASAGTEYTEGDTDASITGKALLWEDSSDTLRPVSASKPLPVQQAALDRTVDNVGAVLVTDALMNDTTALTPKFAIIDAATSGDNTLVAAVTSKKIRVLSLFIVAAGTVTVRFESGAGGTALTGQMNLAANGGFVLPFNPLGWFETGSNTLLNAELSGAVSIDGSLCYVEV